MKLCLFEWLAYLYHCGYRKFFRFLQKIVEIVKKLLIKPQMGTRIHGTTSYDPLTTFLWRTLRSGQVSKNVKTFKKVKIDTRGGGDNFTYTGTCPHWTYKNQIWHTGSRRQFNYLFWISPTLVKGFPSQTWGSSIDFDSRPYKRSALVSTTVLPVIIIIIIIITRFISCQFRESSQRRWHR